MTAPSDAVIEAAARVLAARRTPRGLLARIFAAFAPEQTDAMLVRAREEVRALLPLLCPDTAHPPPSYDADFLRVWYKSVDFMSDPRFLRAYRRGMDSGHRIGRAAGSQDDIHIEWRVYICCWAALHASHLPGDFVECGTNTGIMSLAICDYVDFNRLDKDFFLLDTYSGIPEDQISERELAHGRGYENTMYPECYDQALRNFSPFPRARPIRGRVPEVLQTVAFGQVSYLCLDMNIAYPELAALRFFWPRLVTGGIVVLDDYGWSNYREQKDQLDGFAREQGVEIALLPTGQGLLLKP